MAKVGLVLEIWAFMKVRKKWWSPRHDATVLRSICDRRGLDCLIDIEGFRTEANRLEGSDQKLYFDRDAHWTAAGHKYAGEQIARHLATRSPASR